jgi:hypothetical protein
LSKSGNGEHSSNQNSRNETSFFVH